MKKENIFSVHNKNVQNDTRRKLLVEEKEMQEHGLPRIQNKVCQGGQVDNCQTQEHFCSIDVEKCLTRLALKDKWKRELERLSIVNYFNEFLKLIFIKRSREME